MFLWLLLAWARECTSEWTPFPSFTSPHPIHHLDMKFGSTVVISVFETLPQQPNSTNDVYYSILTIYPNRVPLSGHYSTAFQWSPPSFLDSSQSPRIAYHPLNQTFVVGTTHPSAGLTMFHSSSFGARWAISPSGADPALYTENAITVEYAGDDTISVLGFHPDNLHHLYTTSKDFIYTTHISNISGTSGSLSITGPPLNNYMAILLSPTLLSVRCGTIDTDWGSLDTTCTEISGLFSSLRPYLFWIEQQRIFKAYYVQQQQESNQPQQQKQQKRQQQQQQQQSQLVSLSFFPNGSVVESSLKVIYQSYGSIKEFQAVFNGSTITVLLSSCNTTNCQITSILGDLITHHSVTPCPNSTITLTDLYHDWLACWSSDCNTNISCAAYSDPTGTPPPVRPDVPVDTPNCISNGSSCNTITDSTITLEGSNTVLSPLIQDISIAFLNSTLLIAPWDTVFLNDRFLFTDTTYTNVLLTSSAVIRDSSFYFGTHLPYITSTGCINFSNVTFYFASIQSVTSSLITGFCLTHIDNINTIVEVPCYDANVLQEDTNLLVQFVVTCSNPQGPPPPDLNILLPVLITVGVILIVFSIVFCLRQYQVLQADLIELYEIHAKLRSIEQM